MNKTVKVYDPTFMWFDDNGIIDKTELYLNEDDKKEKTDGGKDGIKRIVPEFHPSY